MPATEDTPARIVAAAERLFAAGGEDATSLRAITREAGVNVAAVHYHFGGRDELLRVVLDRQIGPINARRIELLDAAVAAHEPVVPVPVLLEAFLRPDLEALARLRERDVQMARLMGRAYLQPSPTVASFIADQFGPVAARLIPLLRRTLPDVAEDELRLRLRLVVAVITVLFATAPDATDEHLLGSADVDVQVRHLVAFLAPGLSSA